MNYQTVLMKYQYLFCMKIKNKNKVLSAAVVTVTLRVRYGKELTLKAPRKTASENVVC